MGVSLFPLSLRNQPLGPCPFEREQRFEVPALNESSVRPLHTSLVKKQVSHFFRTNQLVGCFQTTNQLAGGLQTTNQLVGCLQTTNQLVGCLQTTNQLVGGLQTTNQLAGGLQTTNHLVGGLQRAHQLGKVGKWVGSGRGSSRLVQNDLRNCRNVFKRVLVKDSLKKQ